MKPACVGDNSELYWAPEASLRRQHFQHRLSEESALRKRISLEGSRLMGFHEDGNQRLNSCGSKKNI